MTQLLNQEVQEHLLANGFSRRHFSFAHHWHYWRRRAASFL